MSIALMEIALPIWLLVFASGQAAQPRAPVASGASVPLTVLASQVDVPRQVITFTLQNTGTTTITAWQVDFLIGASPGHNIGGHGVDAFREFEGLAEPAARGILYLPPGGTVTLSAALPSNVGVGDLVTVSPRMTIVSDTSFAGEPRLAQAVFDKRADELSAWREMARILQEGRNSGAVDAAKLDSILETIGTLPRAHADIVRLVVRSNLAAAITDVRQGRDQALTALNRLLGQAERNVSAATAHSRR